MDNTTRAAAAAAIAFATADAAAAATVSTVTFEDYSVGATIGTWTYATGTTYPILMPPGTVGYDPTPGIGNYLEVAPRQSNLTDRYRVQLSAFRIDNDSQYNPILKSFDVYALEDVKMRMPTGTHTHTLISISAGEWFTFTPNVQFKGNSSIGFWGGGVRIDNFVFEDFVLTGIPEPSTWAMMIVGFGLVGASVRARRSAVTA